MKNVFLFLLLLVTGVAGAQTDKFELNENWEFSETGTGKWYSAAFPNSVHTDLFENGLIPHPFVGDNEKNLQWISDRYWTYKTEFKVDRRQLKSKNSELVFEGLDTYAKVYLNGNLILETDNAFRTWKADVKKYMKKNNELRIEFTPTSVIEAEKMKQLPYELPEGPRMFTRKAAFQYGWDWGPKYNTVGIWREVYLNFWDEMRIEDFYVKQNQISENIAVLELEMEIESDINTGMKAVISVNDRQEAIFPIEVQMGKNVITLPLSIEDPKLWNPNGLGEQFLYDFNLTLKDGLGKVSDEKNVKVGLRSIELITEKDEYGESFYFRINGNPVFMKGANYIPQNSFQNWVTKEDYEKLLDDVQKSNMNMLRVWGGGIYEDDYFYELCDEKGILVWQDFMFANGMYPGDEEFLDNVRREAADNVKRLRNHASIALWCGNNEISEGWYRWGWQEGRSEAEKAEIWGNYRKIFDGILPETVKKYTGLPYWESSPKYGRGDARYISEGDAHDWWIWHDGHPFENLVKKTPRFMSEFGFQSFPSEEVIRFINKDHSVSLSSDDMRNHQKHSRGFDIIRTYMERDFPVPDNEEDYAYMSQLVQAYGIGKGIEAQRRNRPYTMGSLYWQLNDCWPSVSWSGIDFFGDWKVLQYRVKAAFEPFLLTYELTDEGILNIYAVNDMSKNVKDRLVIGIYDFDGNRLFERIENKGVAFGNQSSVIGRIDFGGLNLSKDEVYIRLKFGDYERVLTLGRPKDMKLKNKALEFEVKNRTLYAKSSSFQKYVFFTDAESDWRYYLEEMLPGTSYPLNLENSKANEVKYKSLNQKR